MLAYDPGKHKYMAQKIYIIDSFVSDPYSTTRCWSSENIILEFRVEKKCTTEQMNHKSVHHFSEISIV